MNKQTFTVAQQALGSARVSRAGECVSHSRTSEDCFGETPKPARETRTLPED
jgi:hypothetical protein